MMARKRKRNKSKSPNSLSVEIEVAETATQNTVSQSSKKKLPPHIVILVFLVYTAALLLVAWVFASVLVFFVGFFAKVEIDMNQRLSITSTIFVGLTFASNLADSYYKDHK